MSKLAMLVAMIVGVGCVGCGVGENLGQINDDEVKVIYCKDFDLSERGWSITRHETTEQFSLYRGGFDFVSVKGVHVLNTNCSFKSTSK